MSGSSYGGGLVQLRINTQREFAGKILVRINAILFAGIKEDAQ